MQQKYQKPGLRARSASSREEKLAPDLVNHLIAVTCNAVTDSIPLIKKSGWGGRRRPTDPVHKLYRIRPLQTVIIVADTAIEIQQPGRLRSCRKSCMRMRPETAPVTRPHSPQKVSTLKSRALNCIEFIVGKGWTKDFVLRKQSIARKGGAPCPWL